ncbi:MAG: hypothetical protein NVS3B10_00940 [Polyangiales bacterium]
MGAPLFGAFFNGVFGKRLGKNGVRLMSLFAIGVSFAAAVATFVALHHVHSAARDAFAASEGKGEAAGEKLSWLAWKWMSMASGGTDGRMSIDVKFSVDELSGAMMLVVTGVGALIHLYSTSYMAKDAGYHRFFAYLNLFVFSMLVLILADNMPLMFVGWEGVGACSYLLIGFWYDKAPNASAGRKAFIANRIGDVGLIGGMLLIAYYTGALDWSGIADHASNMIMKPGSGPMGQIVPERIMLWEARHLTVSPATLACLALFLGCTGKSAQIPLYVWLPDAMAGPTPVSALIHAATMVTSGLYLICRLNFLFVFSPVTMAIIATVGALTALFAATIGLVQNDIKKVLAYSTVSQLGFMFLGVGVGAFSMGFFHVITHAFFKACLFLGAGSVIHAMHGRIHDDVASQDMRNMGGLRRYMPWTYLSMGAATLAISGLPLTSGFFSKDGILFHAYANRVINPVAATAEWVVRTAKPGSPEHDAGVALAGIYWQAPRWLGPTLYAIGILAATCTAFYMFRLLFLTFLGDFRGWAVASDAPLRTNPIENEEPLVDDVDPHAHHPLGSAKHVDTGPHDAHDAAHDAHHAAADGPHHHEHDDEDFEEPGAAPAEAPWTMAFPVALLGALALVAGWLFAEPFHIEPLGRWLEPVFAGVMQHTDVAGPDAGFVLLREGAEKLEWPLMVPGVLAFVVGAGLAWSWYVKGEGRTPTDLALAWPRLHRAAYNKWYVDEIYDATIIGGTDALADGAALMDTWIVDGVVAKLSSLLASALGGLLRAFQNGVVHVYAAVLALGTLGVFLFLHAPHPSVHTRQNGDSFVVEAAPGLGYEYRWSVQGATPEPSFSAGEPAETRTVPVPRGEDRLVTVEVKNAFGRTASHTVKIINPAASSSAPAPSAMPAPKPPGAP